MTTGARALARLGRPAVFYPTLAPLVGGINATILLCQFLYWRGKERGRFEPHDGWLYKTCDEITAETGLSYKEQRAARRELRERGLLEEDYERLQHRFWFRVNMARLDDILDTLPDYPEQPNGYSPSAQRDAPEQPNGCSPSAQRAIRELPKGQFVCTESTTQSTTQSTNTREHAAPYGAACSAGAERAVKLSRKAEVQPPKPVERPQATASKTQEAQVEARPSLELASTPQGAILAAKLTANASANGRRPPRRFPTLETRAAFHSAVAQIGDDWPALLDQTLERGITAIPKITAYLKACAKRITDEREQARRRNEVPPEVAAMMPVWAAMCAERRRQREQEERRRREEAAQQPAAPPPTAQQPVAPPRVAQQQCAGADAVTDAAAVQREIRDLANMWRVR